MASKVNHRAENSAVYPHALDAIVLAGTHRNPKRLISGKNKAFLEIGGRPLVRHVVDALLEASAIAEIFVVGPVEQCFPVLPHCHHRGQTIALILLFLHNGQ